MTRRVVLFGLVCLALISALLLSQRGTGAAKVSGVLEADDVRVGSRVGGRVARVAVAEGAVVKAGDVLVELEPYDLLERRAQLQADLALRRAELQRLETGHRPEDIEQARQRRQRLAATLEKLQAGPRDQEIAAAEAQVRSAEAMLEVAELTQQRTRQAFDRSAATREELDRAAAEVRAAAASLDVARQRLSLYQAGTRAEEIAEARAQLAEADAALRLLQAGFRVEEIAQARAAVAAAQAALAAQERQIGELAVKTPVDGLVDAVDLRPGDLVPANAPMLTLVDPARLWVRAYVPENRLNLRLEQPVTISVDAYPGRRFQGRIVFIARQGEFTPSNIQTPEDRVKQVFRIKVMLSEGLDVLRPGMAADVWLESDAAALASPRASTAPADTDHSGIVQP